MTHYVETYKFLSLVGDSLIRSGASSASTTKTLLGISTAAGLTSVTVSVTMGQLIISDSRGENQLPYTEIFEVTPAGLDIQWRSKTEDTVQRFLTHEISAGEGIELLEQEQSSLQSLSWTWSMLGFGLLGIGFSQIIGATWITALGALISSLLVSLVYSWVNFARTPGLFRFAGAGFTAVLSATVFSMLTATTDVAIIVVSSLAAYLAGIAAYAAAQDSITGWYLSALGRLMDAIICTAGLVTGVSVGIGVSRLFAPDNLIFIRLLDAETEVSTDPIVGAALVSLGFAISCGGRKWQLLVLAATGVAAQATYLLITNLGLSPHAATALAALTVGGACVLLAKPMRLTSNAIMTVSFLPLFPGMMIYQGMLGTLFSVEGALGTLGQALLITYCLSAGGIAGQYLVSEMMWALRRAQFKHSHPGQTFSKVMVDEYNAQDIILPVFSKPFSKVESDGGGQR